MALFQAGHIEKAHETLSELASVRHTGLLMAQKGRNVMLTEEEEEVSLISPPHSLTVPA